MFKKNRIYIYIYKYKYVCIFIYIARLGACRKLWQGTWQPQLKQAGNYRRGAKFKAIWKLQLQDDICAKTRLADSVKASLYIYIYIYSYVSSEFRYV